MKTAEFNLQGMRSTGPVIKVNHKTIVTEVVDEDMKPKLIKRHIIKHKVTFHDDILSS